MKNGLPTVITAMEDTPAAKAGILSGDQILRINGMQTTANNVGVLLHTALKTLRQRYAQVAGDFIPFKPRPDQ